MNDLISSLIVAGMARKKSVRVILRYLQMKHRIYLTDEAIQARLKYSTVQEVRRRA